MNSTEPGGARVGGTVDLGPSRPTLTEAITIKLRTPAKLRNLELLLLIIAIGITGAAVVLVQLGAVGQVEQEVKEAFQVGFGRRRHLDDQTHRPSFLRFASSLN